MTRSFLTAAVLASGLVMSGAAFAQTSTDTGQPPQKPVTAQKQKTQSNPQSQYNFSTPGGQYSARPPATKQRTDGEDVTGNNNFAPAYK